MYNISGARSLTLLQSQTENPYWDRATAGTPACAARAVAVTASQDVTFHGAVWCSWFCSLPDGIAASGGGNVNVNALGVWAVGAGTPLISGPHPVADPGGKLVAALDL